MPTVFVQDGRHQGDVNRSGAPHFACHPSGALHVREPHSLLQEVASNQERPAAGHESILEGLQRELSEATPGLLRQRVGSTALEKVHATIMGRRFKLYLRA